MIENTNQTFPTVAQATKINIPLALNEALAAISDMQVMIEKPEIFISDTLNDFFDYYIKTARNRKNLDALDTLNTLALMTSAMQHYRIYIESALEYVKRISEKMEALHTDLTSVYECMSGGIDDE